MGLFSRKQPPPATHPITDFWTWWAASGHRVDPRAHSTALDELTDRLGAVHPDLTWHFGPGTSAHHRLTVSAGGDARVRTFAERWRRAAPAADATWEFASAQQADPAALEHSLQVGGRDVDLAQVRFEVEVDHERRRVHVTVVHPEVEVLGDDGTQVAFLALDWALGEDVVERWVGAVETSVTTSGRSGGVAVLQAAVRELEDERVEDTWAVAEWTTESGAPGLAVFRTDVRWIDLPVLDLHHRVDAPFASTANGLPDEQGLTDVRALEDDLQAALSRRGVLVGHESAAGVRTFHLYTDGDDQNAAAAVTTAAKRAGALHTATPDPGWSAVRMFTG